MALSLFASPHLLGHDLTLLAPVLVVGLAWLAGRPGEQPWPGLGDSRASSACWVVLSFASLGDLSQNTVGFPGRATPWVLLLMAAAWCVLVVRAARPELAGQHGHRSPGRPLPCATRDSAVRLRMGTFMQYESTRRAL